MSHEAIGRERADAGGGDGATGGAPGRTSRVAARSSVLRSTMGGPARATIDDVATVAVEHRDGGRAVDAGVARRVGGHLGADFSGVRVHDDPLAQEASAAMGARAFAYGGDVFLGPGETDRDVGLMAHELTHVAQQGAAGTAAPQRQVTVGAADSPAEREADAVAGAVTGGARPTTLLVDDNAIAQADGQMTVSAFIAQLRPAVTAAADAALGPGLSALGCPYIDAYLARYATRPAREGEALLRRFEPALAGCATAADMIPLVVARVTRGVHAWNATGAVPPEVAAMDGGASGVAASPPATAAGAGGGAARAMGPGQPLDGAAVRIGDALGADVAGVRVHTGAEAARYAADHGAHAVTVGRDVAFASGAYQPGTIEGDALIAHELAHVVQQSPAADAAPAPAVLPEAGAALEDDADQAAVGAIAEVHAGDDRVRRSPLARLKDGAAQLARAVGPALRSAVSLARCDRNERPSPTGIHYARGATPSSHPSPDTWGATVTQDEAATRAEILGDATAMNAGGVFVFYGHGNPRAVEASDGAAVAAADLGTALGSDGDPPTVVVLGACSTSGMMGRAEAAGVPIVIGFDDNVNSVFLSGTLDQFMSNLQSGQTFAAALSAANAQLARQPMAMGQMVIHYASGYRGGMTLEEARSHHRAP